MQMLLEMVLYKRGPCFFIFHYTIISSFFFLLNKTQKDLNMRTSALLTLTIASLVFNVNARVINRRELPLGASLLGGGSKSGTLHVVDGVVYTVLADHHEAKRGLPIAGKLLSPGSSKHTSRTSRAATASNGKADPKKKGKHTEEEDEEEDNDEEENDEGGKEKEGKGGLPIVGSLPVVGGGGDKGGLPVVGSVAGEGGLPVVGSVGEGGLPVVGGGKGGDGGLPIVGGIPVGGGSGDGLPIVGDDGFPVLNDGLPVLDDGLPALGDDGLPALDDDGLPVLSDDELPVLGDDRLSLDEGLPVLDDGLSLDEGLPLADDLSLLKSLPLRK